jgi:hypothetical protein
MIDNYELPALIFRAVQEELKYPEDGGSKLLFKTLKNYPSTQLISQKAIIFNNNTVRASNNIL